MQNYCNAIVIINISLLECATERCLPSQYVILGVNYLLVVQWLSFLNYLYWNTSIFHSKLSGCTLCQQTCDYLPQPNKLILKPKKWKITYSCNFTTEWGKKAYSKLWYNKIDWVTSGSTFATSFLVWYKLWPLLPFSHQWVRAGKG